MDPKSFPQNLDPKLKEAYDRVMGFAAKPTQAQPASQTPSSPSRPDPIGTNQVGIQSEPKPVNQVPPQSSMPTPTASGTTGFQSEFMKSTPSQTTVKPPEIATYPKPQQATQYDSPPMGQAKSVPYQTESFSNNPITAEPQTTQPKPIPYQPTAQEPQYPPISQPISPSPITEPAPIESGQPTSLPQAVTQPSGKKSSLLTIVIIILGIIFFLIYAFFWIRFFDVTLALPFQLPF